MVEKINNRVQLISGIEVPLEITNLEQEYRLIREEVGVLDYSFTTQLKVSGSNAVDFLQGLITKDIDFLSEEQTLSCLLLEEDGTLIGDVTIYVLKDSFLVDVSPSFAENVKDHLGTRALAYEAVTIEDVSHTTGVLLLEGPKSWKVVQEFLTISVQVIPFQNFSYFDYEGIELIVARIGYTAEYGYKIIGNKEEINKLREAVLSLNLRDIEIGQVGLNSLEVCRLEVRFPNLAKELNEKQAILELGINWLIDFNKVFPGKEAIMESVSSGLDKRAVCFVAQGLEIQPQDKIMVENEEIGYVQHTLYSPGVESFVGIAYVNPKFAASGFSFALENGNSIKTVSSPIIQAKSLSIRME